MDTPQMKLQVGVMFFTIVVGLPVFMMVGLWLFGIWGATSAFLLVLLGCAVFMGILWFQMAAVDKSKRLAEQQAEEDSERG